MDDFLIELELLTRKFNAIAEQQEKLTCGDHIALGLSLCNYLVVLGLMKDNGGLTALAHLAKMRSDKMYTQRLLFK